MGPPDHPATQDPKNVDSVDACILHRLVSRAVGNIVLLEHVGMGDGGRAVTICTVIVGNGTA